MKKLLLITAILTSVAVAAPINIKGRLSSTKKSQKAAQRLINVHKSAFLSCNEWCRGKCSHIQIDPNQNHLFKYVCKKGGK